MTAPLAAPTFSDPRSDRLYALLPAIHRMRDAEQGYPLKALLQVISEQANLLEDDIAQLYDNQFIETAEPWAVPYIGELVGWRPVPDAVPPADGPAGCAPAVLTPRREVANLIRLRRRKGTLALLEELAHDVAGWPARAVEFFRLLGWAQNIDHPHFSRHRLADLRDMDALDRLGGPFESLTHSVDLRRPDSNRTRGRFDIPSVGVFVWRLLSLPVTETPAFCAEEAGPNCLTFSVLGQDAPLFVNPQPETDPTHIADELNLPAAIRRRAFEHRLAEYYGEGLSLWIRTEGWAGNKSGEIVPASKVVAADLSGWTYQPAKGHVAVDPVLGRLAFPPGQWPKGGVRVSYRYGLPAAIGGGEYERALADPAQAFALYRVGEHEDSRRINDALEKWRHDQPAHAVIEIVGSGVYVEPLRITLKDRQTLQLRAADRARPVLRLIDWQTDLPDALSVTLGAGSRMTFDGLLITGRPLRAAGAREHAATVDPCGAELTLRHCTLVPGWAIDCDCEPRRPAEPSLELQNLRARVCIAHSIVGAIVVQEDEVRLDPIPLLVADSIVDATSEERHAISATGGGWAHVLLTMRRCTVFGIVDVHAMALGENTLFDSCVNVARRQVGCVRFSSVPAGCRTPRRYRCQPDEAIAAAKARIPGDEVKQELEIGNEILRVAPRFTSRRYGHPAYAQLAIACAPEIVRGADDESEMGAYHDLFQPQRGAALRARLAEYTPAGSDVGVFFAN